MDEFTKNLLNQLCPEELKYVRNIFFENETNYLQRIRIVDPLTQVTSTNLLQGFAITIHDKNKDSDIIIREEVLQTLKKSYSVQGDKLKVSEGFFFSLKIILHEIGHAKDFKIREVYNHTSEATTGFHFKYLISRYTYKFISEYFAEQYAVTKILNLHNSYKLENYYCELEQIKQESQKIINAYFANRDLNILANNVIEFGWQYFLYPMSHRLGAESAQKTFLKNESDFLATNSRLLEAIEYSYTDLTDLLFELFKSQMAEFDFRIECYDEGDSIFIN